mmetsp:Transcript_12473/g.18126  ORF Transcript_12473/g.18126 Transcript_12473/m.18126 type:complete len:277 (-) Transcript_12473:302-1132(-)
MIEIMRPSLVLPPLITSLQNAPKDGLLLLESFHHASYPQDLQDRYRPGGAGLHPPVLSTGSSTVCTASPSSSAGHSPASVECNSSSKPSPMLSPMSSSRARGKFPERRLEEDRKVPTKVEQGSASGDDIITLFPRRKAGQTRLGGGRGPVVLTLELLQKFYGMPLHVAANQLGICQTAIKKVCRRLGIMKWPYKEMRMPSDRHPEKSEADTRDAASEETSSDLAGLLDTPRAEVTLSAKPAAVLQDVNTGHVPREDDAEVKAAVTALLGLSSSKQS